MRQSTTEPTISPDGAAFPIDARSASIVGFGERRHGVKRAQHASDTLSLGVSAQAGQQFGRDEPEHHHRIVSGKRGCQLLGFE